MKKMYWKAYNFRPIIMTFMALTSLFCLYLVETNKHLVPQEQYALKLKAAELSQRAMIAIKNERLRRHIKINKRFDTAESGLIGVHESIITSDHGVLRSKKISVDPNLAALIVQWLSDLKLQKGDVVAVGMTGSFPGLDISTLAAMQVMGVKPLLISSATSSNWGANIPKFAWLDMLNVLNENNIIHATPMAASIGADRDIGLNLEAKGLSAVLATIKKYHIPLIKESMVSDSIDRRLQLYSEASGDDEIKAYINIGGGWASIGKHLAKPNLSKEQKDKIKTTFLKTGPNIDLPVTLANTNSVATRFLKQGIPVINVKEINKIAADYNLLPWTKSTSIGVGPLFFHEKYNIGLAFLGLLVIISVCYWEMWIQRRKMTIQASAQLI